MSRAPLAIDVRADLFRAAQTFIVAGEQCFGVRVEPLEAGRGVMLIAGGEYDMIALCDPSGHASRAATIAVSGVMTKRAVDLFRHDGERRRLLAHEDVRSGRVDAWLKGADARSVERNVEHKQAFPDWRAWLAPHAHRPMKDAMISDGRSARKIADVARTLARASGLDCDTYQSFAGDRGATVVSFTAHRDAVALFAPTPNIQALRMEAPHLTWRQPFWMGRPVLVAAVEAL